MAASPDSMTTDNQDSNRGDRRRPYVDPTENVKTLVAASVRRADDLRIADQKYVDAELRHLNEMVALRASHGREINALESNRLNAIRQVDVLAVNTAADRAAQAIQALAATTATNAETLRNALNTTATTIANQTAATVSAITERLAALEKSMYEGKGKQTATDPVMEQLVQEVRALRTGTAGSEGKSEGAHSSWLILLGAISGLSGLVGLFAIVLHFVK